MAGYPENFFRSTQDEVHLFISIPPKNVRKQKANQKICQKFLANDVIQKF